MYAHLVSFLRGEGIPALAPIEAVASGPRRSFDDTDHPHDAGHERMAEVTADLLAGQSAGS